MLPAAVNGSGKLLSHLDWRTGSWAGLQIVLNQQYKARPFRSFDKHVPVPNRASMLHEDIGAASRRELITCPLESFCARL